ncbi:sensor histidine kinase [Albimonas pacifica]|uniref:histidine kinase n=1 Tax=Albimonas pacifica TaxID=1114924 RepID=A0A1I3IF03_9RHOB|nr:ATP-binding protein [Albimonas pacifica]SFI46506.1 two-component system, NtrC family, sensor histidine kinase HupT/HoxJ [Albimonas pacifica]
MASATPKGPEPVAGGLTDAAWMDVLHAVDRTYAELVDYQEQLERQNAETAMLRRFMESVLGSVSDALIVVDRQGRVEEASRSLSVLLGRERAETLGRPLADLLPQASRAPLAEVVERVIAARRPDTAEADLLTSDGPAPFEFSVTPRLDERGRGVGAVLTGRPLGELRRAYAELEESHRQMQLTQAHLVRSEKLASLGRLLAGVAHELNNPISFVYANAHALEKYATRFETYFERVQAGAGREELIALRAELRLDRELRNLRSAIQGARDGAERVRDIVADLRRLSADGAGERTLFDLADTARTAVAWVERGVRPGAAAVFEADGPVPALGRAGHIQQVVMNLVQNAFDAAGSGAVRVRVRAEGDRAVLEVSDDGPGVPAELQHAIFDPFFTTKAVGKGTGLGLAISAKIAEEHGGRLSLEPSEHGARFRLDLPARADVAGDAP